MAVAIRAVVSCFKMDQIVPLPNCSCSIHGPTLQRFNAFAAAGLSPDARNEKSSSFTSDLQASALKNASTSLDDAYEEVRRTDDKLSRRHIELDPSGYFVIYVDHEAMEIIAHHYKNIINSKGLACDPITGEVIPCDGSYKPRPYKTFRGRSAKELCVQVLEGEAKAEEHVSFLDHAAYLGREFQKAEFALYSNVVYVQD